jgi:hypothetical protein
VDRPPPVSVMATTPGWWETPFDTRWRRTFVALGVFAITQIVCDLIEKRLPARSALAMVILLLPIAPFAWATREWVKVIRSGDELERRIQIEALSLTFPAALFVIMAHPVLSLVLGLPGMNLRYLWMFPAMIYFMVFWGTWAKYR